MNAPLSPRQLLPRSALCIPAIAGRVPVSHTFRKASGGNKIARLALILMDLGLLTEADAPQPYQPEATMVEKALARWTRSVMGGELQVLRDVQLCVNPDSVSDYVQALEYTGYEIEDDGEIDVDNAVMFALVPWDDGPVYTMKDRCEEIERWIPGLAKTALRVLYTALYRSANPFTPETAAEMGEYMYGWLDENDEESPLPLKDFKTAFPAWVLHPSRKLSRKKLAELACRDPLAAAVLELQAAIDDPKALRVNVAGFWHTSFSVVLRWHGADPLPQIVDDYVNDAHQGGEATSDYTMHAVKLERKSVADFLDRAGRMLRILANADRLIPLIAEELRR